MQIWDNFYKAHCLNKRINDPKFIWIYLSYINFFIFIIQIVSNSNNKIDENLYLIVRGLWAHFYKQVAPSEAFHNCRELFAIWAKRLWKISIPMFFSKHKSLEYMIFTVTFNKINKACDSYIYFSLKKFTCSKIIY